MLVLKGLILLLALVQMAKCNTAQGNVCTCAVMASPDLNAPAEIQHSLDLKQLKLTCDEVGGETCKRLCLALADATNADKNGKAKFCKVLNKDMKIVPSLFSKVCNGSYVYSGKTYTDPICCSKGRPEPCDAKDAKQKV